MIKTDEGKQMLVLQREFFTRDDVVQIARELLGKVICTSFGSDFTSGIIIETEAYAGIVDKASHAYNNRRTARTEVMYGRGGHAYVYLCYGIHSLFNIVTSVEDNPHAVLIRGIEPLMGPEIMLMRSGKQHLHSKIGIGPGNVSKLLGIHVKHSGLDMCNRDSLDGIWVEDRGLIVDEKEIVVSPRVGVDYAGQDALLPYRFQWKKKKETT